MGKMDQMKDQVGPWHWVTAQTSWAGYTNLQFYTFLQTASDVDWINLYASLKVSME